MLKSENVDLPDLQSIQIGKAAFTSTVSLALCSMRCLIHWMATRFAFLDSALLRKWIVRFCYFHPIEWYSLCFVSHLELPELQQLEFGSNSFKSLLNLTLDLPKVTYLTAGEHSLAKLKSLTLNMSRLEVIDAKSYAMYFVETVEITGIRIVLCKV